MSVLINSDGATPQPSSLTEGLNQIQTDNVAIDGSRQRNRIGQKKWASLVWAALTPAEYQKLIGFFTSGSTVTYSNGASNYSGGTFAFTGLPDTPSEGEYRRGSSLLRSMAVTIRES